MGNLTNANGTISHEGEWFYDKPLVKGTKQYLEGIYTGKLKGEMKHGQGRLEYNDGSYHEGKFFEDKFVTGNGTVKYADGSIYEGELYFG